jgi:hypothetical protein
MFEEKVNSLLKSIFKIQPSKKRTNPSRGSIFKFFYVKDTFKKEDVSHNFFLEDLGLLIVKNNLLIQFVESMWLKRLILHLCPKLNFLSKNQFLQEILLRLVKKTNQLYVVHALAKCHYATTSFDLWMFKGACDVFALVINFLSSDGQPKHVIIGYLKQQKQ